MTRTSAIYSPMTREATALLGRAIRAGRLERRWTMQDLAERVGTTRPTIGKVERGDPSVSIGIAFEAARVAGVPLFHGDAGRRRLERRHLDDRLALLPKTARRPVNVDNDF